MPGTRPNPSAPPRSGEVPAHVIRYLVVFWLLCLSADAWLVGRSTVVDPSAPLVVTLSGSVCVLGSVWGCLVVKKGRPLATLIAVPVAAALVATTLTSVAVTSDPDNGPDSFYPLVLIPFYAIALGVPLWSAAASEGSGDTAATGHAEHENAAR